MNPILCCCRVHEAQASLRKLLSEPPSLPLYVIVGAGKHSKGKGKLGPAIKDVVAEFGLRAMDCVGSKKGSVICISN